MSDERATSPRTPVKPMAFDSDEFAGGAARAVALHLALYLIISELISIAIGLTTMLEDPYRAGIDLGGALSVPIFIMIYAVPISLIATVIGVLPAFLLGRGMVRIRVFRTHLLVWCAFGIVFCGAVSLAVAHFLFGDAISSISAFVIAGFVSGATAIPLAWARTALIALRKDRGLKPLPWLRCRRRGLDVALR